MNNPIYILFFLLTLIFSPYSSQAKTEDDVAVIKQAISLHRCAYEIKKISEGYEEEVTSPKELEKLNFTGTLSAYQKEFKKRKAKRLVYLKRFFDLFPSDWDTFRKIYHRDFKYRCCNIEPMYPLNKILFLTWKELLKEKKISAKKYYQKMLQVGIGGEWEGEHKHTGFQSYEADLRSHLYFTLLKKDVALAVSILKKKSPYEVWDFCNFISFNGEFKGELNLNYLEKVNKFMADCIKQACCLKIRYMKKEETDKGKEAENTYETLLSYDKMLKKDMLKVKREHYLKLFFGLFPGVGDLYPGAGWYGLEELLEEASSFIPIDIYYAKLIHIGIGSKWAEGGLQRYISMKTFKNLPLSLEILNHKTEEEERLFWGYFFDDSCPGHGCLAGDLNKEWFKELYQSNSTSMRLLEEGYEKMCLEHGRFMH